MSGHSITWPWVHSNSRPSNRSLEPLSSSHGLSAFKSPFTL